MRTIVSIFASALGALLLLGGTACTRITPLDVDDIPQQELLTKRDRLKWEEEKKTHEQNLADSARIAEENKANRAKYLEDLLAYKASDHPLMFGWFNAWNPSSPEKEFSLSALPDSVDWVSNWGSSWGLDDAKKADLAEAQSRGIRMTIGWIIENVGNGITAPEGGWLQYKDAEGKVDVHKAIDVYVEALCDSIRKYNYDGMDVDYEPQFMSPFKPGNHCGDWNATDLIDHIALISCDREGNKGRENYFFTRMREELDKLSKEMGKPLMFNINGSLRWLDPEVVHVFDYFIAQSYNNAYSSWVSSIDRYKSKGVDPKKQLLLTESFENNPGNAEKFVENYAQAVFNHDIAGIGAYHINEDMRWGPDYKHVRDAISVMNPHPEAEE